MKNSSHAGAQALASIEHVIADAAARTEGMALAVLAGLLLARAVRRRGGHWSWPAAALGLLVVLAPALGSQAEPVAVALLVGAVRCRRWHRLDLDSGGDLERAAGARRSIVDVLGARLRAARIGSRLHAGRDRAAARLRSRAPSTGRPGALELGRDERGGRVFVRCDPGAAGHTLVVGATGSGKTVTQTLLAIGAIERGAAAIVVDPKGDRGMREQLRAAAEREGRELLEWTPTGPCVYNPYARGGETEIADRALAGERFTEPHYLRQSQRYLGHVVRTLRRGRREVCLSAIVELLDPGALELALRELPREQAAAGHAYLDSLSPRQLRDLAGVRDRLAILTESDVGRWLDPGTEARRFDVLGVARSRAVAYMSLEADSRPLLAQMLGAAVVQDLQSAVAALQGEPAPTVVVLDEFSALAAERVVALFGRARSAGFSLLLGTQELSDLRLSGSERLLERVMGNLSMLIAHRQVVPASAELLSRMAGTRGAWRVSWGSDGRSTRTRIAEPALAPERLARLAPGWALVLGLAGGGEPAIAHVVPAEERR
jgi:TraM recognition site of TraD and TraG/Type IV secretion-system coupling protein DNA-binding domain